MNMPRIICFDLGGVVVRICRTWEEACLRAGVEVRDMPRFRDPALARQRHEIVHQHQTGAMDDAAFFRAIADASAGLYSPPEVERIHLAWTMSDYPGVAPLIARLNALPNIRTACLSNTNNAHWGILTGRSPAPHADQSSDAIPRLHHHLVSHELRAAKPHESIYRLAESALGAPPREILFFDDLEENVNAARALGWRAERIDHTGDTAGQIEAHLQTHGVPLPRTS